MKSYNYGVYACDTSRGGFASLPSKSLLPISHSSSITILCIIMHAFLISASVSSSKKSVSPRTIAKRLEVPQMPVLHILFPTLVL